MTRPVTAHSCQLWKYIIATLISNKSSPFLAFQVPLVTSLLNGSSQMPPSTAILPPQQLSSMAPSLSSAWLGLSVQMAEMTVEKGIECCLFSAFSSPEGHGNRTLRRCPSSACLMDMECWPEDADTLTHRLKLLHRKIIKQLKTAEHTFSHFHDWSLAIIPCQDYNCL